MNSKTSPHTMGPMKPVSTDHADGAIRLHLLCGIAENPRLTQRRAARDLGVALGIVNNQLKALVGAGHVRIKDHGGNRYTYFLTPMGEAERGHLFAETLTRSLDPFARARADCLDLLNQAAKKAWTRIALVGRSPLVDAMVLGAGETGVTLLGIIDSHASEGDMVAGLRAQPDARGFGAVHALVITDVTAPEASFRAATRHFPADRVLVPALLGLKKTA